MAQYYVRETFFRPPEYAWEPSTLPGTLYNDWQLLLKKSRGKGGFVPIRSMQFQAVMESEEIIFVDSQGGYAHQDGVGGRLIRMAWRPQPTGERTSLTGPVPCEIVHYFPDLEETRRRLMSEFPPVLRQLLQRRREQDFQVRPPRVVPLRRPA